MFSHLSSGGRVNTQLIQEHSLKELFAILHQIEGTKAIVWDDSLAGPVGLVATYLFLKEQNVKKMFPLNNAPLPDADVKSIIFITRPNILLMDYIALKIHAEDKKRRAFKKDMYLYFLPRKSMLCEKHLQMKGVYGSINFIGEFNCDFFPIDNDVISMELKDSYKELYIENDLTCLHQSALALVNLQKLYGRIAKVNGKGNYAQKLWELTKSMGKDEIFNNGEKGSIDQMIIVERSIDNMSVLATQLTYEGLIDEIFGINNTTLRIPAEKFTKNDDNFETISATDVKQIVLNSKEELYVDLRDKNFNAVGPVLSRLAKSISSRAKERHGEKTIQELKKFVESLPNIKANELSLANHTKIAELIKEVISSYEFLAELACEQEFMVCSDVDKPNSYIEDLIAKKAPIKTVIRLICMQSIAGSGLKSKILDYYKRELVHVYGTDTLLTLINLERAGLLKVQTGSRTYAVLRKTLRLTVEDFAEVSPKDISYVHSFYAPLSIRIVEQSLKPTGWQVLQDLLSSVPGATFDDYQSVGMTGRRGSLTSETSSQLEGPRVILVFFLGGCTYAEISALRFLAQQEDNNVEFIIATTKLVNKNTFLDSCIVNKTNVER